jgi:SAM-dependent methyltransferase
VNPPSKQSSWEDWGRVDPLWAIVTEDGKEHGKWDLDDFFASGRATIDSLWQTATALGLPKYRRLGLDFGCGIGRLTRPLGEHLDEVIGLDVSPSMIELAKRYHRDFGRLTFSIHQTKNLESFAGGSFDTVCCLLVLQHLQSDEAIGSYIQEFIRVLAPGGMLLLQLPDYVPTPSPPSPKNRLRPRARFTNALHRLGMPPRLLYEHAGWKPEMTMRGLPTDRVISLVRAADAEVMWLSEAAIDASTVSNRFYVIAR